MPTEPFGPGFRCLLVRITFLLGRRDTFPTFSLGFLTISTAQPARNFGIMQEYNERKNKKLINNIHANEEPKFWVTSSRPSNFGDHLDVKTKVDNWFDDNRLWNEESKDYEIKRAQIYML